MSFISKKGVYIPLFVARWGGGRFEFDILGLSAVFRMLKAMRASFSDNKNVPRDGSRP